MNGYSPAEVDALLVELAEAFEVVFNEHSELKAKVHRTQAALERYARMEETLKKSQSITEKYADMIMLNAKSEAELLMQLAQNQASRTLIHHAGLLERTQVMLTEMKNLLATQPDLMAGGEYELGLDESGSIIAELLQSNDPTGRLRELLEEGIDLGELAPPVVRLKRLADTGTSAEITDSALSQTAAAIMETAGIAAEVPVPETIAISSEPDLESASAAAREEVVPRKSEGVSGETRDWGPLGLERFELPTGRPEMKALYGKKRRGPEWLGKTAAAVLIVGLCGGAFVLGSWLSERGEEKQTNQGKPATSVQVSGEQQKLNQKLIEAAKANDTATTKSLLASGADPNALDAKKTPVLLLAITQDDAVADALLKAGAKPDLTDSMGVTPLMQAAWYGKVATVKALLDHGANPNLKQKGGNTALIAAASQGKIDAIKLLVPAGADVNAKNEEGWTPLLCAAYMGKPLTVKYLIDKGADANAKNNLGWSALGLALSTNNQQSAAILKRAGATSAARPSSAPASPDSDSLNRLFNSGQ